MALSDCIQPMNQCPTTCQGTPIMTGYPLCCSDVDLSANKCSPPGVNPLAQYEPGNVPPAIYPVVPYDKDHPPASLMQPPPDWAYALYKQYAVANMPTA